MRTRFWPGLGVATPGMYTQARELILFCPSSVALSYGSRVTLEAKPGTHPAAGGSAPLSASDQRARSGGVFDTLVALVRAARPAQWLKNVFVLAPLAFTPERWSLETATQAGLALATFCAASSATYLWNDWCDLDQDRQHPKKRLRPMASGHLQPGLGLGFALGLAGAALVAAAMSRTGLIWVVGFYLVLQIVYSRLLKRLVILDVMTVSAGFVLRVLAGGVAVNIHLSSWFLVTTSLLALFLGFTKRRQELVQLRGKLAPHRVVLGDYNIEFIDQMNSVLAGSCIVCYALFTVAPETIHKFGTEALIATLPFVIYGILRYLHLIHVRDRGDDPTEIMLTDRPLQICVVLWMLTFLLTIHFKP